MNTKNRINSKLLRLTALMAGFALSSTAFAQTIVNVTTDVSGPIQGPFSIKQSGTGTPTLDTRFIFEKLDTVAGGQFAGYEIQSVIVTLHYITDTMTLTLTNDGTSNFVGQEDDFSSLENRFTGSSNKFEFQASTFQDSNNTSFASSDFVGGILIDWEGITVEADDSFSEVGDIDILQTRNVASTEWGDYTGTGDFFFNIRNDFFIGSNVTGDNLTNSQIVGNTTIFAEVEYIVIPEPGTIALMVIAFGGAAGMSLLRRRKRD